MENRSLPSQGLTAMQMAHAIRSVGLEPALIGVRNEYVLKGAAYAYLRGHVPALLGVDLFDTTDPGLKPLGRHAVAVTGFSLGYPHASPRGQSQTQNVNPFHDGFLLKASRVDKLYAHDDQVGPFARMEFDGQPVNGGTAPLASLSTSWGVRQQRRIRACPELMLVPLYHKIRIPFEIILDFVIRFDGLVEALRQGTQGPLVERPVWDIYLTTIKDLKSEVARLPNLDSTLRRTTRLASLPRFVWRATAECNGIPVLDLLFDATDVEQGRCLTHAIEYDPALSRFLRIVASDPALEKLIATEPENRVLSWFRGQPTPSP